MSGSLKRGMANMPINVIVGERNLLAAQASAEGISLVEFVKRAYVLGLQSMPGGTQFSTNRVSTIPTIRIAPERPE